MTASRWMSNISFVGKLLGDVSYQGRRWKDSAYHMNIHNHELIMTSFHVCHTIWGRQFGWWKRSIPLDWHQCPEWGKPQTSKHLQCLQRLPLLCNRKGLSEASEQWGESALLTHAFLIIIPIRSVWNCKRWGNWGVQGNCICCVPWLRRLRGSRKRWDWRTLTSVLVSTEERINGGIGSGEESGQRNRWSYCSGGRFQAWFIGIIMIKENVGCEGHCDLMEGLQPFLYSCYVIQSKWLLTRFMHLLYSDWSTSLSTSIGLFSLVRFMHLNGITITQQLMVQSLWMTDLCQSAH